MLGQLVGGGISNGILGLMLVGAVGLLGLWYYSPVMFAKVKDRAGDTASDIGKAISTWLDRNETTSGSDMANAFMLTSRCLADRGVSPEKQGAITLDEFRTMAANEVLPYAGSSVIKGSKSNA